MPAGSRPMKYFMKVEGNPLDSHFRFLERLTARLQLHEASSEEESDVIIAFVAVASRAGTDIEAALQRIPETPRPAVLVVLHHTFDPYFVAPQSRLGVHRTDMFVVDCLFHEDRGLLRCERNDVALKAVTDHLISKGASETVLFRPWNFSAARAMTWFTVVAGVSVAAFFLYRLHKKSSFSMILQPRKRL